MCWSNKLVVSETVVILVLTRLSPFEPFPDNLSPEEILAQAQAAAKEAKEELALRRPKTDVCYSG